MHIAQGCAIRPRRGACANKGLTQHVAVLIYTHLNNATKGNTMFVKAIVNECDFTGEKYSPAVEGAHVYARGASGRWCVVMYAGPKYIAEHGYELRTMADLEAHIGDDEWIEDWTIG